MTEKTTKTKIKISSVEAKYENEANLFLTIDSAVALARARCEMCERELGGLNEFDTLDGIYFEAEANPEYNTTQKQQNAQQKFVPPNLLHILCKDCAKKHLFVEAVQNKGV